jgi:hypothetical protein
MDNQKKEIEKQNEVIPIRNDTTKFGILEPTSQMFLTKY